MHQLQTVFATEEGEAAWTSGMRALLAAGGLDEAEALLAEALTALDTELAWSCLELPREAVVLTGWEELAEAIALHAGDPVTGVTIAIGNDADRDFEKGAMHRPHVLLGTYTDEAFAFSTTDTRQILAECDSASPRWAGREEDIEVHMEIEGLDQLNTRLAHHKQRHFLRDQAAGADRAAAPLRYIEFVLGCWWRALRWHQAVAAECAIRGLPRAMPVVAGMVAMRPGAVAVHSAAATKTGENDRAARAAVGGDRPGVMADSFGAGFIQRREAAVEWAPPSVSQLRRLAQGDGDVLERQRPPGLLARLFGRR